MADIFGGVEPPAWLTHATAQKPGELGRIIGELVGGLGESASVAIDKATSKQAQGQDTNWIKEMPGSIQEGFFNARMNLQNPLWKMQVQQAQLNMAQQGLAIKNQQSLIEARGTKLRMQEHDQDVLPKWLQDHPTWESRQDAEPPVLYTTEGQRMLHTIQFGDNQSIKEKALVSGLNANAKSLEQLRKVNPTLAGQLAPLIGKAPADQVQQKIDAGLAEYQAKVIPKAQSPLGKMEADKAAAAARGEDTAPYDAAIAAFGKSKSGSTKLPPALTSEIISTREQVNAAQRYLDSLGAKDLNRPAAEKRVREAQSAYNQKLNEADMITNPEKFTNRPGQPNPPAKTPATAPAGAPANKADPLGLF
jgi:hypothetical protein